MKKVALVLTAGVVVAILGHDFSARAQQVGTDLVRVWGSRSVASRMDTYAKEFMNKNPGKSIVVVGARTDSGFAAFLEGNAELLMMSRALSEAETEQVAKRGMKLRENQVGVGAVALVVNPSNPVKDLTFEQASKIFSGQIKNWKEVGGRDEPIQVITIDDSDADTLAFFREKLLGGEAIVSTAVTRPKYQAVLKKVAQIENAIGFALATDIYALARSGRKDSVRVLGLSVREGTQVFYPVTTVGRGHSRTYYPLERPYFLFHDSAAKGGLAKAFADFCEQSIITNPGDYLDRQY